MRGLRKAQVRRAARGPCGPCTLRGGGELVEEDVLLTKKVGIGLYPGTARSCWLGRVDWVRLWPSRELHPAHEHLRPL